MECKFTLRSWTAKIIFFPLFIFCLGFTACEESAPPVEGDRQISLTLKSCGLECGHFDRITATPARVGIESAEVVLTLTEDSQVVMKKISIHFDRHWLGAIEVSYSHLQLGVQVSTDVPEEQNWQVNFKTRLDLDEDYIRAPGGAAERYVSKVKNSEIQLTQMGEEYELQIDLPGFGPVVAKLDPLGE